MTATIAPRRMQSQASAVDSTYSMTPIGLDGASHRTQAVLITVRNIQKHITLAMFDVTNGQCCNK